MGHSGEALIFLMPHERLYVELLSKRGITLQVGVGLAGMAVYMKMT